METLTDGVVTLVRWRPDHLDLLVDTVTASLDHVGAWLFWAADGYDRAKGEEFLSRSMEEWESGGEYNYAIFTADGLAGGCGLMRRDDGREIGYWLAKPHTGKGYVTRASALLVAEAWRQGATHVLIKHDRRNTGSGAVPPRLGFTEVGEEASVLPLAPACSGVNRVWRLERPE
ncbi:GNAT family N-acetyltransferase [Amycolatopsis jejuensis]|uniref:GNAT family N-acetyltransferase n=1 Tax=Amycolatopsis jejuensis TaxID=330084 RepID=UPI000A923435|nr:GNAT family N-acetyltransferase [Amycolatopsis jejuensis]